MGLARHGQAWPGAAWIYLVIGLLGTARPGRLGLAWQGQAWQGRAWLGTAWNFNRSGNELPDVELLEREVSDIIEAEGPMEVIRFKLTGRTILLMNSAAGVNPLNPLVKQKGVLTSKKPKQRTDEDINEIYRLDFELGMYHDPEIGPFVPGVNLEAAILVAAKIERMGPKAQAGVRIMEDMIPLEVQGAAQHERTLGKAIHICGHPADQAQGVGQPDEMPPVFPQGLDA